MGGEERVRRGSDDTEAAAAATGVGLLHPQVAGHDARLRRDLARQGIRMRTGNNETQIGSLLKFKVYCFKGNKNYLLARQTQNFSMS